MTAARVNDHIRQHILASLGMVASRRMPDLDALRETEWCQEFEQLRRNRVLMAAFRYGPLAELKARSGRFDIMAGLIAKMEVYCRTGNTEALVDAANYLMLEFMTPSHPQAHFRGEDDCCHCPTKETSK